MAINDNTTGLEEILNEIENLPTTAPNPHKLIFSGDVSAEYDGSEEVTVPFNFVSYSETQELTVEQKALARINIESKIDDFIVKMDLVDMSIFVPGYHIMESFSASYDEMVEQYNLGKKIILKSENHYEYDDSYNKVLVTEVVIPKNLECVTCLDGVFMFEQMSQGEYSMAYVDAESIADSNGLLMLSAIQPKLEGTSSQIVGFSENGNATAIDYITPYLLAQDGGYTGTEEKFKSDLANIGEKEFYFFDVTMIDESTFTSDVTYAQVLEQYQSGKEVVMKLKFDNGYIYTVSMLYLTSGDSASLGFNGVYNFIGYNAPVNICILMDESGLSLVSMASALSTYEYAKDSGYTGTEEQFKSDLASLQGLAEFLANY